jgi:hypothetical protein
MQTTMDRGPICLASTPILVLITNSLYPDSRFPGLSIHRPIHSVGLQCISSGQYLRGPALDPASPGLTLRLFDSLNCT